MSTFRRGFILGGAVVIVDVVALVVWAKVRDDVAGPLPWEIDAYDPASGRQFPFLLLTIAIPLAGCVTAVVLMRRSSPRLGQGMLIGLIVCGLVLPALVFGLFGLLIWMSYTGG